MAITHPHLYGLDDSSLKSYHRHLIETETLTAYLAMAQQAKADGIEISICSAYRSFERQLAIFNGKADGSRPLLDKHSQAVSVANLSEQEILDTILLWSALPGTSRHHWGTDIDLFDAACISPSDLQLISAEYEANGPCHQMHLWLEANAGDFGFYRPFQAGKSGVSPEPWHYSYHPVSQQYLSKFDADVLTQLLKDSDIALKPVILANITNLVEQYVFTIAHP